MTTKKKLVAFVAGLALLLMVWEVAPARIAAGLLLVIVLALLFKAVPKVTA